MRSGGPRLPFSAEGTLTGSFAATDWILIPAVALAYGSSFVLIEIALEAFPPTVIVFMRLCIGVLLLAGIPAARQPIDRTDLPRVAVLGFTWMAAPFTLYAVAQQWVSSALTGMLTGAIPIASMAITALLLRRRPRVREVSGIAAGFLGVAVITWPGSGTPTGTRVGIALILVAVLLFGLSYNLAVPLQQRYGSLPVIFRAAVAAALMLLPFALPGALESLRLVPQLGALVALGLLGTSSGYVLMATLVGRVGADRGTVALYLIPVVALVLGVLIRHERVAATDLGGLAIVMVGAILVGSSSRRSVLDPT